ncbi:MAG: hypothetical protein H6812_02050 [Phycisphaeraceae bacterium]|nr:hypothetical protein [Phycisphaerales bacterium]MCB9842020.1 hypothetical protein [Phycisphaeraceae bacterium]
MASGLIGTGRVSGSMALRRLRWMTHFTRLLVGGLFIGVPALVLIPAVGRSTHCYLFRGDRMYFITTPQGIDTIQTHDYLLHDASEVGLPIETPFYCANAWIRWGSSSFGVQRSFDHTLTIESPSGTGDPSTLTPAEVDAVYARYATHLRAYGVPPDTADLFLKGPGVTTVFDWTRALSVVLFAGIGLSVVYGLGWRVSSGAVRLVDRPDPDIDPETGRYIRCPNCKYDLEGLSSGICPECGEITTRCPTGEHA